MLHLAPSRRAYLPLLFVTRRLLRLPVPASFHTLSPPSYLFSNLMHAPPAGALEAEITGISLLAFAAYYIICRCTSTSVGEKSNAACVNLKMDDTTCTTTVLLLCGEENKPGLISSKMHCVAVVTCFTCGSAPVPLSRQHASWQWSTPS